MKFGENLKSHLTAEWRTQYIDYDRLKDLLEEYKLANPLDDDQINDNCDYRETTINYKKFKETFFDMVENELIKVNTFFLEQLNASERKFRDLTKVLGGVFLTEIVQCPYMFTDVYIVQQRCNTKSCIKKTFLQLVTTSRKNYFFVFWFHHAIQSINILVNIGHCVMFTVIENK